MRRIEGLDRAPAQWALVAACILLAILLGASALVLFRTRERLRGIDVEIKDAAHERESLEAQLARERSTREAFQLEIERSRTSAAGRRDAVTLQPSATRSAQPPPPSLGAAGAADVVLLRLALPEASSRRRDSYQIVTKGWSDGRVRWSRDGLRASSSADGRVVMAHVTGEMLPAGAYEIVLNAQAGTLLEEVARYDLTVR